MNERVEGNLTFPGIKAHYSPTHRNTSYGCTYVLVSAISRRNHEVYTLDQLFHGHDTSVVRFMTLLSDHSSETRTRPRSWQRK